MKYQRKRFCVYTTWEDEANGFPCEHIDYRHNLRSANKVIDVIKSLPATNVSITVKFYGWIFELPESIKIRLHEKEIEELKKSYYQINLLLATLQDMDMWKQLP